MALRLLLVPPTMDKRRLRCLVVRHGTAFTIEIDDRDALVATLQRQLCGRVASAVSPHALQLFLARDDESRGWLLDGSDDAALLALEAIYVQADDAGAVCEAVAKRFLTERNAMDPAATLRGVFPEQPPLYGGTEEVIHVLVCVATAATPHEPTTTPPVEPERTDRPRWAAALLESLQHAIVETHVSNATRRMRSTAPPALVVRSSTPSGVLWFPVDDVGDDGDDSTRPVTSMYVPSAWRELSTEIFAWVIKAPTRRARFTGELRGRRALLSGAPRGGKSTFLAFMLLQLLRVRDPPVCIVDVPGVAFARIDGARGRVDEGDRARDFRDELSDVAVVYLFDVSAAAASSRNLTPLSARTVFARSILVRPHQRIPRASKRTQSFALPLWTQADVHTCAVRCFPWLAVPSVVEVFSKWGGVPGWLFVRDPSHSVAALDAALDCVSARDVVDALACVARDGAWPAVDDDHGALDVWRALVVPTSDAATARRFVGGVAFTSQFVCDRALALAPLSTRELNALAAQPALPALTAQLRVSLAFLAQEEEEKHAETPEEHDPEEDDELAAWRAWWD